MFNRGYPFLKARWSCKVIVVINSLASLRRLMCTRAVLVREVFVWWFVVLFSIGCQPPPLDAGFSPSIDFIFPKSNETYVVCPNFMAAVDIDNLELIDYTVSPEAFLGQGHWHFREGSQVLASSYDEWVEVQAGASDLQPGETSLRVFTAVLAQNDHTEFSQIDFPESTATLEIQVGWTDDCVGGVRMDTGS